MEESKRNILLPACFGAARRHAVARVASTELAVPVITLDLQQLMSAVASVARFGETSPTRRAAGATSGGDEKRRKRDAYKVEIVVTALVMVSDAGRSREVSGGVPSE